MCFKNKRSCVWRGENASLWQVRTAYYLLLKHIQPAYPSISVVNDKSSCEDNGNESVSVKVCGEKHKSYSLAVTSTVLLWRRNLSTRLSLLMHSFFLLSSISSPLSFYLSLCPFLSFSLSLSLSVSLSLSLPHTFFIPSYPVLLPTFLLFLPSLHRTPLLLPIYSTHICGEDSGRGVCDCYGQKAHDTHHLHITHQSAQVGKGREGKSGAGRG
jgi:hypothetical protein